MDVMLAQVKDKKQKRKAKEQGFKVLSYKQLFKGIYYKTIKVN